jgi:hypothetical protein
VISGAYTRVPDQENHSTSIARYATVVAAIAAYSCIYSRSLLLYPSAAKK